MIQMREEIFDNRLLQLEMPAQISYALLQKLYLRTLLEGRVG